LLADKRVHVVRVTFATELRAFPRVHGEAAVILAGAVDLIRTILLLLKSILLIPIPTIHGCGTKVTLE